MSVLVTGGCGFIGTNFVRKWLLSKNEVLVNIDKLTYASNKKTSQIKDQNYCFIQLDINNSDELLDILKRVSPRLIFHFAAETHVDRSINSSGEFINANINGTHALLETTLKYFLGLDHNAQSQFKFVNISTDEVYGSLSIDEDGFTENSPLAPNSPYSASKASGDLIARSFHKTYSLPVVITRCSNNFGPFQNREKFIPKVITAALKNKEIPIYGSGTQIRDWLYVEDHVDALIQVAKNSSAGEVFNIGGGVELENVELARTLCRQLEFKLNKKSGAFESLITHVEDRPGHDFRYSIDATLIKDKLDWRPEYEFTDAIEQTINYYLT